MPQPSNTQFPNWVGDVKDAGIRESYESGKPEAEMTFMCPSNMRGQLISLLIGTSIQVGTGIVRTYPAAYPPLPTLIGRAITSVKFFGPAYSLAGFLGSILGRKYCWVTCRFGLADFYNDSTTDPSGQPYTTTTFQGAGEFVTIPNTSYKFTGTGTAINQPIGLTLPQLEITMVRHLMPYAPVAEIAALQGCVNQAPLQFTTYTFATGTVLFLTGDTNIQSDTLGLIMYETTYKMMWRKYPWNYYLSPTPGVGWAPVDDGSGNGPYTPGDFTTLP